MKSYAITLVAAAGLIGCQPMNASTIQQEVEGPYDTESRYDMSSFSGIFGQIAGQWVTPDALITNRIVGQVESQYGSSVASTFRSILGQSIQTEINSYVSGRAPWVYQVSSGLNKVDAQMKTLDVQTTMLVVEDGTNYKATQTWNGISLFDDPSCRDSGGIGCSQTSFDTASLLDSEYPVEIISSDYVAQVDRDQMNIESGSLDFNYGRLGLVMLTNQLLPAQASEGVGFREVVLGAVNCRGMAGRLADKGMLGVDIAGVDVGVSLNDVIGNCEDGVLGQVNGFVDLFEVPVGMSLTGQARLHDVDFDGQIDQINEGSLGGTMALQKLGVSEEGPVSGQFIGFRVGDIP
jgi:hypothetical protein